MKTLLSVGIGALGLALLPIAAHAQSGRTPSARLNVLGTQAEAAGDGYLTASDLWSSVKPSNTADPARLGSPGAAAGFNAYLMFGSSGNWNEPGGQWPSGYPYTNTFRNAPRIMFPAFKATGWPGYSGTALPTGDASVDRRGTGSTSRFMFPAYKSTVVGASDATRNYKRPARFVDAGRTHLVYEAGWPTTAGIDFKIRAHQFTPNEQNLNDFTVLEITLTNTGIVDSNGDGTAEATGNVVDGVAMSLYTDVSPSIFIGTNGDRACNCINAGRTFGYIATPDATGAPHDLFAWYANVPPSLTAGRVTPPVGRREFGIDNYNQLLGYSDIWNAWTFLGVKQGSISDNNLGAILPTTADKLTAFGTPGVGSGARRGWYGSMQWQGALYSRNASDRAFRSATATWYADYGKTSDGSAVPVNLGPNPNFFSGGTADDITTFTVSNANARPNGDFKYASEDRSKAIGITQPIWEPMWNPQASSGNFYDGGIGFNKEYTFGEAVNAGNGPYRLAVGESITIVWTALAGFRMEGVVDAAKAARWAWDRGWQIDSALPVPAAPEMNVESTTGGKAIVRWSNVSSVRPISGYKIWRSAQYKRRSYLDRGMRAVDRYHEQHTVGTPSTSLLDAVNPNFDAQARFVGDIQGSYQFAEWGDYELVAKIPTSELSQYANASGGYTYGWEDPNSITGFTYWYYVSAYIDGSYTGPLGRTVDHLESANFNRNGRNGQNGVNGTIGLETPWFGTYPYATANALYPKTVQGLKNIGAAFTVVPPVTADNQVDEALTVWPNPYKITGLNDVRNDPASHTINFFGMPASYTLTIMDVSGQIVHQATQTNGTNGRAQWDLFSKDGVEVSSGLYVYHLSWPGGQKTGRFAILR